MPEVYTWKVAAPKSLEVQALKASECEHNKNSRVIASGKIHGFHALTTYPGKVVEHGQGLRFSFQRQRGLSCDREHLFLLGVFMC